MSAPVLSSIARCASANAVDSDRLAAMASVENLYAADLRRPRFLEFGEMLEQRDMSRQRIQCRGA